MPLMLYARGDGVTSMDQDRSTKASVQGRRCLVALLIAFVALTGYSWLIWP